VPPPARFWIVKGHPARNDLDTMLAPGRVEPWGTGKHPQPVFFTPF
jgi:hypothetical protein